MDGGEGGIRTLDTGLPYTHFPGVLLQPLGHLSRNQIVLADLLLPSQRHAPILRTERSGLLGAARLAPSGPPSRVS